jgi:probable HAF family extracellular repeat protein
MVMATRRRLESTGRTVWRRLHRGSVLLMLVATAMTVTLAGDSATFTPTDLGTLGGDTSYPLALSDTGIAVGYSNLGTPTISRAFRWTQRDGMTNLGTLGGTQSIATGVSESGVIAGASETAAGSQHAFVWTEKAGLQDLGTLPAPFTNSYSTGISKKGGVVIGLSWKTIGDAATHGFAWTQSTGMVDLGGLGGDTYPNAVNSDGLVVGTTYTSDFAQSRPFAWTRSGGSLDLGSLGGLYGEALAVNATGMVVGYSYGAGSPSYPHPFVWTQATGMLDLGTLANGYSGYATAVNDDGVVVGYTSTNGNEELRAFKWSFATGMISLGTLTGGDSYAVGISKDGLVVGNSVTADGAGLKGFAWTTTLGLMEIDPTVAGTYTQIENISDSGRVFGFEYQQTGAGHATLWKAVLPKVSRNAAPAKTLGRGR